MLLLIIDDRSPGRELSLAARLLFFRFLDDALVYAIYAYLVYDVDPAWPSFIHYIICYTVSYIGLASS